MPLYYCKLDTPNFGDDMNSWFWSEVAPELPLDRAGITIFGIGSILWNQDFDRYGRIYVMGSGSGYGRAMQSVPDNMTIGWVRGPRTAARLDLPSTDWITDPACMVSLLSEFKSVPRTQDTLLIPHVGTSKLPLDWERVAADANAVYVSPVTESKEVIKRIASAKCVVTESLHGAIIADAFRIPWAPIAISPTFNSHKWLDWAESMRLELNVAPCITSIKALNQWRRGIFGFFRGAARSSQSQGPEDWNDLVEGGQSRSVEYLISDSEKVAAKAFIGQFAYLGGKLMSRAIRSAVRHHSHLSQDAILIENQTRIRDKIGEVGRLLKS